MYSFGGRLGRETILVCIFYGGGDFWNKYTRPTTAVCLTTLFQTELLQNKLNQFDPQLNKHEINPSCFFFMCMYVCVCVTLGARAGPAVVQLGQLNEISGSNINSSASLMRTKGGNCLGKERYYGSSCCDRAALFTEVTGLRGPET